MNVHDSSLEDDDKESPVAMLSQMNLNDETLNGNIIPIETKPKGTDLNSSLLKNIFSGPKKPKKATVIDNDDTTAELDKEEDELSNNPDKQAVNEVVDELNDLMLDGPTDANDFVD